MPDHETEAAEAGTSSPRQDRQEVGAPEELASSVLGSGNRSDTDLARLAAACFRIQRAAGNHAVALMIQRAPPTVAAPPDNIAKLDELLDKWIVPRQEVVNLLGTMTAAEKSTVRAGYRDKLASKLNFQQMKQAVTSLGADLPTKLDWMEKATFLGLTSLIKYGEISDIVKPAPQPEKDLLKSGRWKSFFISVCTNTTIIPAVQDLDFRSPHPDDVGQGGGERALLAQPGEGASADHRPDAG